MTHERPHFTCTLGINQTLVVCVSFCQAWKRVEVKGLMYWYLLSSLTLLFTYLLIVFFYHFFYSFYFILLFISLFLLSSLSLPHPLSFPFPFPLLYLSFSSFHLFLSFPLLRLSLSLTFTLSISSFYPLLPTHPPSSNSCAKFSEDEK